MYIPAKPHPPSWAHWLGTDRFVRDVLSRLIAGAVNSIDVSLVAVGICAGLGVPLGALAAARCGSVVEVLLRLTDLTFPSPELPSALMILSISLHGSSNSILAICIFAILVPASLQRAHPVHPWD